MLAALPVLSRIFVALIILRVSPLAVFDTPIMSSQEKVKLPPGLIAAIEQDDLETVKRQYAELPIAEQKNQHTLYEAASLATSSSHAEILSFFFSEGLVIGTQSAHDSIIEKACGVSSIPIFRVLIEEGHLDPSRNLELYGDPLTGAVFHGDVELAEFLLSKGADPNTDYPLGHYSSLVWSIVGDHNREAPDGGHRMMKSLLDGGAIVKETGALIAAADVGNTIAVQVLLEAKSKGLEVDLEDLTEYGEYDSRKDEGTALWCGARSGNLMAVNLLLEAGASEEFRDRKGRTPIEIARANGHQDVVDSLAR
ncbi:uncharacterized protein KY384_002236 [Bacidia gigantensis]|uniref:uncharacterized protein n=1 Tax=Bacidia gigantensis TaxID=2732470 RepID=UPI001D05A9F3|nr:uncharacterized protein KY384_002236 [Bacidia gigantensis]KAG8533453.1 hypothetical protein KY384_002236 [Bacidia gigantensis]